MSAQEQINFEEAVTARQREYLEHLQSTGALDMKAGSIDDMMEQWTEVNLPAMTPSSQSEERQRLPVNSVPCTP